MFQCYQTLDLDDQRGGRLVAERRCSSGKLHFEKITGYELIRGNPTRLFSHRDGGVIRDCAGRCESDARCMGFNMDYNRNECQAVTTTSENNLFNLRPSSGVSYYEGVCLKGNFGQIIYFLFQNVSGYLATPLKCK